MQGRVSESGDLWIRFRTRNRDSEVSLSLSALDVFYQKAQGRLANALRRLEPLLPCPRDRLQVSSRLHPAAPPPCQTALSGQPGAGNGDRAQSGQRNRGVWAVGGASSLAKYVRIFKCLIQLYIYTLIGCISVSLKKKPVPGAGPARCEICNLSFVGKTPLAAPIPGQVRGPDQSGVRNKSGGFMALTSS